MNRVEISGGLTRDPEFKFLPSGTPIIEFTVAVNGARYDGQAKEQVVTTAYIACNAFGWLAEQISELGLGQGDEVYVLGELAQTSYEKRDGSRESKTRVTAMKVDPVRRRVRSQAPAPAHDEPPPWGEEPF